MSEQIYQRIRENPDFNVLVRKRSQLSWALVAVVLVLFYGLILVVAFNPSLMGQRLGGDTSAYTLGVAVILAMFVFFWIITALYVKRANGEFDDLTRKIVREATQGVKK
jgi:cation/acetate symporter